MRLLFLLFISADPIPLHVSFIVYMPKMFQFALFILQVCSDVIAHPLISDLDYSSFSWLPDEATPIYTGPDDSAQPDLYAFDLFDDTSQNNWEVTCTFNPVVSISMLIPIPANSVSQDSYVWEPLVLDEPVIGLPSPFSVETATSNEPVFEPPQFIELGPSSPSSYTDSICPRGSTTSENEAICHVWPECENGRMPMCCSRMTKYGRPTECTPCLSTLDATQPRN